MNAVSTPSLGSGTAKVHSHHTCPRVHNRSSHLTHFTSTKPASSLLAHCSPIVTRRRWANTGVRAPCRQQPTCRAAAAASPEPNTTVQPPLHRLAVLWLGQVAAAACRCLGAAAKRLAAAQAAAAAVLTHNSASAATVQEGASSVLRQMRMLALVIPFAQVTGGGFQANVWMPFWQALFGFTHFYLFILFMRVLLSWFPALDWSRNPWLVIKVITDPYLNVFRNLIPALFMAIDLTPLLGFMLLQDFVAILENCVVENLFSDTIDEPTSDPFIYMPQDYSRFTPTKPA